MERKLNKNQNEKESGKQCEIYEKFSARNLDCPTKLTSNREQTCTPRGRVKSDYEF